MRFFKKILVEKTENAGQSLSKRKAISSHFYETHKGKNRFHKRHRAQKIRCIQGTSCRARGDNEAQVARIRKGRARHRVRQGSPRLDYEPSRKMADFLPPEIVFVEPACFTLIFMKNDSCKTAGVFSFVQEAFYLLSRQAH